MAISITYLGSTSDAGGSGTTLSVDNIDTTGAKALVIAAKHDGAATTITPSANNDATGWTSLPKRSYSGGEPHAQIFYKLNPTGAVGDDPQIALAAARSWKYLAVWKITADSDVELIDETSAEGVGTSRNAGNLVATAASVAVYLDTIWTGGAHTPGGTWTERYDVDAGAFDRTGTGAETYAASSTFSGGDLWVGVAAAFQEVGSGAAPVSAGNRFRPGLHPAAGPFNPAQFTPRRGSRDNPATGGGDVSVNLTGQSVTVSAGSLTSAISQALSGQAVTASAGTVVPAVAQALSGQVITASAGTAVAAIDYALSGQQITTAQGTVGAQSGGDVSVNLSGQAVTVSAGSLTAAVSQALSGQQVSTSAGSVIAEVAPVLSGLGIVVSQGSVGTEVGGDVSRALTGQSITIEQGTLGTEGGAAAAAAHGFSMSGRALPVVDGPRLPWQKKRQEQEDPAPLVKALPKRVRRAAKRIAEQAVESVSLERLPDAREAAYEAERRQFVALLARKADPGLVDLYAEALFAQMARDAYQAREAELRRLIQLDAQMRQMEIERQEEETLLLLLMME